MTEHAETPQQLEEDLGRELLRIHEDSYGKGASEVKVLADEDAIVVFMDGLELQRSEEFLIEKDQADTVIQTRGMYQQAIESTFTAAVERVTGRRVVSFASVTKLDPNYIVEIFRLGERSPRS
jgi:uncharacterized protein YbcI